MAKEDIKNTKQCYMQLHKVFLLSRRQETSGERDENIGG